MHFDCDPRPQRGAGAAIELQFISAPTFGVLLVFQPLLQRRVH
jgi:hypothetical protein